VSKFETNEKILSNGAVELLRKPAGKDHDIVLALLGGQFVTWTYHKKDGLYRSGDYFGKDLQSALDGYNSRED
jgi:hypothetical protein